MFRGMKTVQRFSLLLLDEGEDYLQEYVVNCQWPMGIEGNLNSESCLPGTLRLCSKSLFFEPDDFRVPVVRIPFRYIQGLVPKRGKDVELVTSELTKMKPNNVDQPYVHVKPTGKAPTSQWLFTLLYADLGAFLKLANEQMNSKDDEEGQRQKMQKRLDEAKFDSSRLVKFDEKIMYEGAAVHILPMIREPGKLVLTDKRLYFQPLMSVSGFNRVLTRLLTDVAAVCNRRSALKPRGLELFFVSDEKGTRDVWDRSCAFFEFRSEAEREKVKSMLVEHMQDGNKICGLLECHEERLQSAREAWLMGKLSNLCYLFYLNMASGRTLNDLRQWPVFPWVLKDYTSRVLDLDDPDSYRDLSKPIGALNPQRLDGFKMRYQQMEEGGSPPPFLYGTHYSTPGYVMFWLVRVAPAHTLQLQRGKFDYPDRMFYSVADAWESVMTNPADVKELIPEFFLDDIGFLTNQHCLALGKRQNGKSVNDVELPPWADSPADFLEKNRAALESRHVSKHLHEWIDLIFGYKQKGVEAKKADNEFYYLSYEGAIDIEAIEDPLERRGFEAQINEFGQTPKQLFREPHPQRVVCPCTYNPATLRTDHSPSPKLKGAPGYNIMDGCTATDKKALRLFLTEMRDSMKNRDIHRDVSQSCQLPTVDSDLSSDPPPKLELKKEKKEQPAPVRQLKQQPSIYERMKEEWGFQPTERDRKSAVKKNSRSPTAKAREEARIDGLLDQFCPQQLSQSLEVNKASEHEVSGSWCPFLFSGMKLSHSLDFHSRAVRCAAISSGDGGMLYSAGDNAYLNMFSLEAGKQVSCAKIERQAGKQIPLSAMDLLPPRRQDTKPLVVFGCVDGHILAYSTEMCRLIGVHKPHDGAVSVVKLMNGDRQDGRLMTASSDGMLNLWNVSEGRAPYIWHSSEAAIPEMHFVHENEEIRHVAHSRDFQVLITGTNKGVTSAWDIRTGPLSFWTHQHGEGSVGGLEMLQDDEHVLCGFGDGTVKVWSMKKPNEIVASVKCPTAVHGCISDGLVSLHGQEDGQILFWNLGHSLGKTLQLPNQPVPNLDGFLLPLVCTQSSIPHALCAQIVRSSGGKDSLWVVAGQESGDVSVFESN